MRTTSLPLSDREKTARVALESLGPARGEAVALHVNCPHSHHLAVVIDTPEGLVYRSTVHGRSHGHADRVDTPHRPDDEREYVDLLLPAGGQVEDALPAWCDCGQRLLSRTAVAGWVAARERRVVVD
jgi:hypothetical protein